MRLPDYEGLKNLQVGELGVDAASSAVATCGEHPLDGCRFHGSLTVVAGRLSIENRFLR